MIGRTVAHYEIEALLGKGGMGEVYRARDTKLGRDVALKSLPQDLAADPERLARFRREAQLLASLNHPNIAAIYGLEEVEGYSFLVMELAEGEDLAARIERGPLPTDEAVAIARQIAEGLEEAHEKGIVHRDLKPANVMVSTDGKVKILDFGLARAYVGETAQEGDPALSPTITAAMTQVGVILGSAAYMSPEQAKGRGVDRRTDIWAFGVILYEMITGRALFRGDTISETMASVLKDPVEWERLPSELPPSIRVLLERCLERDPRQRLRDIGEARIHLGDPTRSAVLHGVALSARDPRADGEGRVRGPRVPWLVLAVAGFALAFLVWERLAGPDRGVGSEGTLVRAALESPPETGFHLTGANPAPIAISPDGTRVVYGARDELGVHQLWLQVLASPEAVPISGTAGAQYPFWSPDGRSVAYFADGSLRTVDLEARTNREIVKAQDVKGGCWLPDGTILYTAMATTGISRVDVEGGAPAELTRLEDEPRSNSHRLPRMLPDGRHFLYAARKVVAGTSGPVSVMIGDLEGSPPRELTVAEGQAEYANGHILYVVGATLFARPFDLDRLEFTGAPVALAEDVGVIPGASLALFSVSRSGALVYHPGHRETLMIHLAWYDREDGRVGELGQPSGFGHFDLSPDGRRVVFAAYDNQAGVGDLYLHDVESDVRTRLTFDTADEGYPVWSPDGRTVYYASVDAELASIVALDPDSRAEPRTVYRGRGIGQITAVSPDGQYLAFTLLDSTINGQRAVVLPLDGGSDPVVVDEVEGETFVPRWSPDGRWIVYASRETGNWRIYLKTFPLTSRKWQLTERDAFWYGWDPSGERIFHQWSGAELYATEVDLSGSTPRVGQTQLFLRDFPSPLTSLHHFEVGADGSRFLVSDAGGGADSRPARLVLGWPRLVERSSIR